jgi:KamA family protein
MNVRYFNRIEQIPGLTQEEKSTLKNVTQKFPFRANEYYLSLIDWQDPEDPIRRIIIPSPDEIDDWGNFDASNEKKYTPAHGIEHKYPDTAILLISKICGSFCRFCFRKRLFDVKNREVSADVTEGLNYIRQHKEINNVLLTGGECFILPTPKLEEILSQLRQIDHVQIIRLGSKMVAFNPIRFLEDPEIFKVLGTHSTPEKRIYIMAHFNHPRELTKEVLEVLNRFRKAGVELCNQTPLIRGVNDKIETLVDLFNKLSFYGIPPYYVFQCRPVLGNHTFSVPLEEGYSIFCNAIARVSGLAKRARFVMSHASGKIEIVGMDEDKVYMRYHRAANPEDNNRLMIFKRNPDARWLDDYYLEESNVA